MRPILRSEAATADSNGVTTITNLHQLALIGANQSGNYKLAVNLDASATKGLNASDIWSTAGWVGLANFAGTLDGNGHTISGLTSTTGGLFASTTSAATIHDLSVTSASISGTGAYTGILVNDNAGRITNVSTSGTVSGSQSAGGLAGRSSGAISGSSSSASVTANAGSGGTDYNAGGLVAVLTASGTISQSYATGAVISDLGGPGGLVGANYGAITLSYATGATSGIDGYNGGLVSYNQGTISNSYATGAVGDTYLTSGGLVALNRGTISTSYATGAVDASSGGSNGGFVGSNNGTISASFWDTQASGQSTGAAFGTGTGLTGLTTAQMQNPTNFINAGWDYGTAWGTLKTGGTPVLRALNTAPLISYYVVLSGNTSTTYGNTIGGTSGITVGGDGASLVTVGWGSAINSSTNAGTYAYGDPNVLSLTYRGGAADDFFIDYGSGALTINQRIVNLSGNQTYNGTTNIASGNLTLSNLANGETLTLSGLGQLASKNVGSNLTFSLNTLALGNGSGLASNYTLAGGTDTITISKALISSIGGIVAGNKTYDGSTAVTLDASGVVFDGMAQGDALTLGAGFSGLFSDANAGSGKVVTISGLSLTGADAGNYTLASNTTTTLADIGQRVINLSGNRVYDGTTVLDHSMLTLSNLLGNETLTLSGAGSMGDKNAGNGKAVALSSLLLGDGTNGGLASNYVLGSGTVDITKATISTISGITANGKTYDGSTNATLNTNGVTFNGMVAGDALTLGAGFTGLFADANAGSNKAVTISGLSLAGADAGNYTLTSNTASALANIAQRVISLSGNRVYDGTTALDHSMLTLSNLVGNETLTLSGTGSMGDKNAGDGKSVNLGSLSLGDSIHGDGGLASNYVLGTGTVDIAKAVINTIGGITASGKTYDGSANAVLDSSGVTFTGKIGGDVLTLGTGFSGLFSDANAGSNKTVTISGLSLVGADAGNYTLANTTATTLANIGQRVISLSGNRIYDGTTALDNSIFALSNLVSGETLTLSGTGSMGDKNAGNGKSAGLGSLALGNSIHGDGGLASNYVLGTGTVDIAKATITTIGGITTSGKTYDGTTGATLNSNGASFTGMVAGDVLSLGNGFSGLFSDANAGSGKMVTISGLSLAGADAGNYTLANTSATTLADIGQRVIGLSGSRTYNGSADLDHSIFTLSNLVSGETLTLSGIGSMTDKNAGNGKSVSLGSLALGNGSGGGLASNYTLVGGADTVDIAKATISSIGGITANGKTYDGTTGATLNTGGVTFNGMVAGDVLSLGNGLSGAFSDKNAGTGKTVSISGLSLSGTDAGNYTLSSTTATTLADIARASLTLSGFAVSNKTYDGSVGAGISNAGTLDGLVANDTVSFGYSGATFSDKNAGTGKTVTLAGITLSGTDANNYTIASTATTTADIGKATISSIGGITAGSKTYDGTTAATLDGRGAVFNGMVAGDVLTLGGATGAFSDKNAGSGKTVNISGLTLSGADAGNYTLASNTATTTADIAKAYVFFGGISGNNKVYDGTTTATVNIYTIPVISTDDMHVGYASANFSDKNAGSSKTVTISGLYLTGADAGNYQLGITDHDTYASITRASISSIGGITASGKTYDGTTDAVLNTNNAVFNGMIAGDSLTADTALGTFANANAGSGKTVNISGLTLGGADAGNYTLANTSATTLADIGQRVISLSGSRTYNGSTDLAASIFTLSNLVGTETLTLSGTGTMADKNAGNGKAVSLGSLVLGDGIGLASNYTLTGGTDTVDIARAVISSIGGIAASGKTYDGDTGATLDTSGVTFNGLVAGDVLSLGNGFSGLFSDANAGSGKMVTISGLSLAGADAGNYTLANTSATTLADIGQRVIGLSGSRTYNGSADLDHSIFTLSNLVSGETLTLSGIGSMTDKNAGNGKGVSLGSLALGNGTGGGQASNYTLAGGNDTVDIAKAVISSIGGITANGKTYDGTTDATLNTNGVTFNGMVAGDVLTLGNGFAGTFSDKNVGTGKVVDISGLSLSGADAGNYTLSSNTAAATADIARALLTINSFTVANKTYDGTTSVSSPVISLGGVVAGDLVGTDWSSVTFSDKNAGTGKTVTANGLALAGSDAGNYTLASDTATTTADISRAVISSIGGISANGKTYDGTTNALLDTGGVTFNGMIAGDVLTLGNGFSGAFGDKNAGTGKTVTISGLSLGGTDAGNYTLANTTATTLADIGQRVIGLSGSRTYNGSADLDHSIFTLSNLVSGETLTLSGTGAMADKNAGNGKSVNLGSLALGNGTGGGLASNYTLVGGTDTVDVARAVISSIGGITANGKTYDGTTDTTLNTSGVSFNGIVPGDVLALGSGFTGLFSDANAGTNKTVSISGLTLDGADAGNYTLASNTATTLANIAQRVISLSGSRTYNGSTDLDHSIFTLSNLVTGETLTLSGTGAMADKSAGTGKSVSLGSLALGNGTNGGLASNYTLVGGADMVDIAKAVISSIGGISANGKTYDGSTGATLNTNGATFNGMVAGDVLTLGNGYSGAFADANAGAGKTVAISGLSLSGADAGNYTLADTTAAALADITRRAITVAANNQSRVYGDANPALSYTIGGAGLVNNDNLSGALATAASQFSNVGIYGIGQGSLAASGNYDLTFTGGSLAVTPRAITVAANSASRSYGDQNPLLGYITTGLVNGDSLSGALSTSANAVSNVGSYAIGLGTLGNANYTIGYTGANLTITPRLINVVANNASRATGSANPLFTYTIGGAGLVNGDRLFGQLASAATSFSSPGSYAISRGSLAASGNYNMSFIDGVLTVTAAPTIPSAQLASVGIPRSYAPDTTPLLPVQEQAGPTFVSGERNDQGGRPYIVDPRFDGTVVCFGNGEGCVVRTAVP
ncbi:YDG domain-containing protein [uncultured Rhizobium sp.]|uniref:YDG domain-containing protein n=1 Tax=uncultured Rhizobium sp. TaxID=155567 RepID=UPI00262B8C35|nr:YDG domain-containing protein [uncultured Rhizobium sp.]